MNDKKIIVVDELKKIIELHKKWRLGEPDGVRAVLTRAVLTGATLLEAHLAGADLTRAVLTRADLTRADLTGADLTGADLTRAVLTGADLTDADLKGAILNRADLSGAILTKANLTGAVLTGATLLEAHLAGADLTRAVLTDAILTGAVLTGATLLEAHLAGADLTRADLRGAKNMVKIMGVMPGNFYWKRFEVGLNNNNYQYHVGLNTLRDFEVFADDERVLCSHPGLHFGSRSWCASHFPNRPLEALIRIPEDAKINEPWATDGKASADKIEIIQVFDTKTGNDVTEKYIRGSK